MEQPSPSKSEYGGVRPMCTFKSGKYLGAYRAYTTAE